MLRIGTPNCISFCDLQCQNAHRLLNTLLCSTPTDDLLLTPADLAASVKAALPVKWNRPYLGYDPRSREGDELGAAARLARSEKRVFSDSEIYSPVFPRGRPPGHELDKGPYLYDVRNIFGIC